MNPHFIFNSLQSIQSFISKREPEDAEKHLVKFSKLMRLVLDNSLHREVSIEKDMEALDLYLELESLRVTPPFTYQIKVDETIDIEMESIPPLILQPFVENAIKHGLLSKGNQGHISIRIDKVNNNLICTIEDNGIGRNVVEQQKTADKKSSLGIKLTWDRLRIMYHLKKGRANLNIVDLFSNDNKPAGNKVELSIPMV